MNNVKFCAKCGKLVNATKCPHCNYTQDKTYIAIKIRQSKKNFFFIGSGIVVVIIVAFALNWAINDGYGPLYDRGDFILEYEKVRLVEGVMMDLTITTDRNQQIHDLVRATQFFENIIASYNDKFKLPYDVPVYVGECGEANAFWLGEEYNFMVICYELIDDHFVRFGEIFESDAELIEAVQGAVYWIFVHELGHGFIDIYELPLLGPHEDTSDTVASIILISEGPIGINSILAASTYFQSLAIEKDVDALLIAFVDNHGLDIQRYTDMLCFIYGSDPSRYLWLVTDGHLHELKAGSCQQIYDDNNAGWAKQLEPYAKFDL